MMEFQRRLFPPTSSLRFFFFLSQRTMHVMQNSEQKIIVGISGGVDSSVTAMLLKEQGYDVHGLFMKNWNEHNSDGQCTWENDVEDALLVCEKLDIPLNTVDLSKEYWERVFTDFVAEYKRGRTPNPDVYCNQEIKFKAFLNHAFEQGADKIATGHYASIQEINGELSMIKGLDENKDQTYFLYRLNPQQIQSTLFPLGEFEKPKVREMAEQAGLITYDKKDSTGICFIGEQPFREFLEQFIEREPGNIITTDGIIIGEHIGVYFYTLGQRQGLGIGGIKGATESPWYVVQKNLADNELIVAQEHDHPLLFQHDLRASEINWTGAPPETGKIYTARIRHRQKVQNCKLTDLSESSFNLRFEDAQRAITPGQSVVLYDGQICIGGGIIDA